MSSTSRFSALHVSVKGFTLFETLIVASIIVVLALLALPPIRSAQKELEFSAAAHRVRAQLHEARILAIVRNEDCRFRVTSPTSYVVECQTPSWAAIETHDLAPGFQISANNRPEFHPMGNVGPMGTIRVLDGTGRKKRIVISRSGRIRID